MSSAPVRNISPGGPRELDPVDDFGTLIIIFTGGKDDWARITRDAPLRDGTRLLSASELARLADSVLGKHLTKRTVI